MIIENEVEILQRLQSREAAFRVLFSSRDDELQAKRGKDNAENIGLGWKSARTPCCCHLFFSSVWCLLMPLATCERSFQWVCTRDFVFKNAICILANEQRISQQKVINELLKDQTKRASSKKKHMELMNTSSGGYSCFMRDRIASCVPVFLRGIRVRSCRPKAETAEQNCRISMTVRNWFLLIAVLITSEGTWHSKGGNESRWAHF